MRYDPVLEICAFLFMLAVAAHFFSRPRYPSNQNRFFTAFIIVGLIDVLADIASAYVIEYSASIPMWINWFVNMLLYYCQIALAPMLFLYILCMTNYVKRKNLTNIIVMMLPFALTAVLLTLNPWTGVYFYFDQNTVYRHGNQFLFLYIGTVFYLTLSAIYIIYKRHLLRHVESNTMLAFIATIAASIVIQYYYPQYLLTGVALSLAIVMMYLTLQNPDDMLDMLTGTFNRQSFMLYAEKEFAARLPFHMILVDIEGTRMVNSLFGIGIGDQILEMVGGYLKKQATPGRVFRLIGDSFGILLRDETMCSALADRIASRFQETWMVGTLTLNLSATVGYIRDVQACGSPENVMSVFEHGLRHAKRGKREGAVEIGSDICARFRKLAEMEKRLQSAIEKNEIEVYFQPIYDLERGRFSRMEALARMRDEQGRLVPPDEFIPIAERTGLIIPLGAQVMRKAFHFLKDSGLEGDPEFRGICINLSPVECLDDSLIPKIAAALEESHADPAKIWFEITETTTTISDMLPERMKTLRDMGFHLALDDFGTGYANYDSIMRLPFSIVKIDKSMLDGSAASKKAETVFLRTIDMVHALGCNVIVEGVETEEQVRFLKQSNIRYLQGYFFARPVPKEDALNIVLNSSKS